MSVEKSVGFVFSGVGVALIIAGLFWTYNSWDYSNRAVKVSGQLIDQLTEVCESTSGSGSSRRTTTYKCYRPVVQYKIAGETHESRRSVASSQKYSESNAAEKKVNQMIKSKHQINRMALTYFRATNPKFKDEEIQFIHKSLINSGTDYTEDGLNTYFEWKLKCKVVTESNSEYVLWVSPDPDRESRVAPEFSWELTINRKTGFVEKGLATF
jgi:hypothetical protein